MDGHRRTNVYRKAGRKTIRAMVVEGNPTPAQIRAIQFRLDAGRKGLKGYDHAVAIREVIESSGIGQKQAADEVGMDAGLLSRYMSLFNCPPQTQQAAKEGRIKEAQWYAISRSKDPLDAQARILGGRPDPVEKLKMSFAGRAVTVGSLPGGDLDLESTEELLKEALKAVKSAKRQGISASTFSRTLKDINGGAR